MIIINIKNNKDIKYQKYNIKQLKVLINIIMKNIMNQNHNIQYGQKNHQKLKEDQIIKNKKRKINNREGNIEILIDYIKCLIKLMITFLNKKNHFELKFVVKIEKEYSIKKEYKIENNLKNK